MRARNGLFIAGVLALCIVGCRTVAYASDCYRIVLGELEVINGIGFFTGCTMQRLHSSCPPLTDCKFDYFVDENGNGRRDPGEPGGTFGESNPGDFFGTGTIAVGGTSGVTVHYSYEASKLLPDGSKEVIAKKSGKYKT